MKIIFVIFTTFKKNYYFKKAKPIASAKEFSLRKYYTYL